MDHIGPMVEHAGPTFSAHLLGGEEGAQQALQRMAHYFKVDYDTVLMAHQLGWLPGSAVQVLWGLEQLL